ncbi:MAG: TatD family hydrolase [Patescibacteria group bacterium]
MKIIDTHSHPQFPQYDPDRDLMLARARKEEIGIICVGTDWEMSKAAIELAEQNENMWASVGLHPNDNLAEEYDQEMYREMAAHPKVVAIGEVGLDYYRTTEEHHKKKQRERFEKQIELAVETGKPLIIHCRDAHDDMTEILKNNLLRLKSGGVIHSFTGKLSDAKKYIDLGFYIGLNGIITFTRQYDETVMNVPLEKILLETDAPYLTPEPHRGKRNESSFVVFVAEQIARLRGLAPEKVISQTTQNTERLFLI